MLASYKACIDASKLACHAAAYPNPIGFDDEAAAYIEVQHHMLHFNKLASNVAGYSRLAS